MGSFNDFCLDEKLLGDVAKDANFRIQKKKHMLFNMFHLLKDGTLKSK